MSDIVAVIENLQAAGVLLLQSQLRFVEISRKAERQAPATEVCIEHYSSYQSFI